MAFDARAMVNIATAPASLRERLAASWIAAIFAACTGLVVALHTVRLPSLPAFVPTVASGAVVALIVTAIILTLQYRVSGDGQLVVLALAYVWAACAGFAQLLMFPDLWGPGVAFGASPQASAWLFIVQYAGLGSFVLAFALVGRFNVVLAPRHVRTIVAGSAVLLVAAIAVAIAGDRLLPRAIDGVSYTPLYRTFVVPAVVLVYVVTLAAIAAVPERTVTRVWMLASTFGWALSLVATQVLPQRFSLGWYEARLSVLAADMLVLAVFLVKFQGLLGRLAATSEASEARYRALTNAVPQLIWTTDANGEVDDVNDRWIAYTGAAARAARADDWRTLVHPQQAERARENWAHALRTGDAFVDELRLREAQTDRYRWFLVNIVPQRDGAGRIARWIGAATDIDANKRVEERDAFVARAGERLGASLDTAAVLSAMKALVVPRLAERCEVQLRDDEGRFVLAAIGAVDVRDEIAARHALGRIASPEVAASLEAVASADGPVAENGTLRVALRDRGELVGVLTMARARPFEPDDAGIVRDLAGRAATALRHARNYERERTTADALQRAMLPSVLPQRSNVTFSASYSAASESQRVGGDFYDAFVLPDGRVALTIGDVTGHGLEAAVIMGEIRQAIRASAFDRASPAAILDRASRLLEAGGRGVFVTAVFGILDPVAGAFTYATAGHPPPLLYDGATLVRLRAHGLPLGLREDDGMDFALTLRAPTTIVLFTDGLMEFNRDLFEGERRIEQAVRDLAGTERDHLAGALMQAVLGTDEPTDDVAILTASLDALPTPSAADVHAWRFPAGDRVAGALVRHAIGDLAAPAGAERRFAAELALGELLANVVRHAPGPAHVRWERDDAGATLVVEDEGAGFVSEAAAPAILAESGRGLALVRALADDVTIGPGADGGTRVCVRFLDAADVAAVSVRS